MRVTNAVYKVVQSMELIGVVALLFTMAITSSDVVLGVFRHPIDGAYDLAGIASGIAISFSIAITSWKKLHIQVDTIYQKLPAHVRVFWTLILQFINLTLFAFIGIYLFQLSANYKRTGEVCGSIPILPLWPIAFLLGCACLAQCLVSIANIENTARGGEEHE